MQFEDGSWHNRNYIAGPTRPLLLSVPVKHGHGQSSEDAQIDYSQPWQRKHIGSIRQAYQKRPFFALYFPVLELLIREKYASLARLNIALMDIIMTWLGIDTSITFDTGVPESDSKTGYLINMCKRACADGYLSGVNETYVNLQQFKDAGLSHSYQKFVHPVYDQGTPAFVENLSAIDWLFNVGPQAAEVVREWRHVD